MTALFVTDIHLHRTDSRQIVEFQIFITLKFKTHTVGNRRTVLNNIFTHFP